ncbi:hypothetical protein ACVWYG_001339 [Pedobacter sp. UYEF25]
MQNEHAGNREQVKLLLNSAFLTASTRNVLENRFERVVKNSFFDIESYTLLSVICDLLMNQDPTDRMVDIASFIDERLKNNDCDGWRYDSMPKDDVVYRLGLKGIEEASLIRFDKHFILLAQQQQIDLLSDLQNGELEGEIWKKINPKLFFEDLLAETAAIFFSHPEIQISINYVGMADAKGWTKLKLNQTENLEND